MHEKIIQEVEYLLAQAEEKIACKTGDVMMELCWHLGCVLRDLDAREIREASATLARLFDTNEELFEMSYYFYKDNPIKRRAIRRAS